MTQSRPAPRPAEPGTQAGDPSDVGARPVARTGGTPPSAFLSAATVSTTRGLLLILTLAHGVLSAAYFGASAAKDCYIVAQAIPSLIATMLMSGVYGLVLVALVDIAPSGGTAGQLRLVRTVLFQMGVVLSPLCLAATLFPRPFVALIAPGFGPEQRELTGQILPFTMFAMLGTVGFAVLRALYNARHAFALPGLVNLLLGFIAIGTLVLLVGQLGIMALALGQLLGALVSTAMLGLAAFLWLKDPPGFVPDKSRAPTTRVRDLWRDFLPLCVGANFGQVNLLVDNAFASRLSSGNITQLGFASTIFSNAEYLTIFALAEVAFARFTAADRRGPGALEEELHLNLRHMLLLAAPVAAGCLAFGQPLARLLFERGQFGPDSTLAVARILACLGPEIIFMGYFACFWRILFARRRLRLLVWTSLGAITLNAVLNALLMKPLGIQGIALSTTFVTTVFAFILGALVRREGVRIFASDDRTFVVRVLLSAAVTAIVAFAWSTIFERAFDTSSETGRLIEATVGMALAGVGYAVALWLQRIPVVPDAMRRLVRKATEWRRG